MQATLQSNIINPLTVKHNARVQGKMYPEKLISRGGGGGGGLWWPVGLLLSSKIRVVKYVFNQQIFVMFGLKHV